MGAAAALVEWLPRAPNDRVWRQWVTTGAVVALGTSFLGAGILVPLLPALTDPIAMAAFVVSCATFALGAVIDYVCVVRHRGGILLVRNTLLTGLRIPLYLGFAWFFTAYDAVVLAWAVSSLMSILWAVWTFHRTERSLALDTRDLGRHVATLRHSLAGQHLITVTAMAAGYALPLLVVWRLSAQENAYFYITWMLGSIFFIISPAISTAVFAAGAQAVPGSTKLIAVRAMRLSLVLLIGPIVLYLIAGRWLLLLFGDGYARAGTVLLLILTVSAIPDAVTNVAVALLRASGRLMHALALNTFMLVIVLVASWWAMPQWGIVAVGWSWLAAQCAGTLWVALAWRSIVAGRIEPATGAADSASEGS